jgi:polyhydroxyalkanoate synthesis regulator phasin
MDSPPRTIDEQIIYHKQMERLATTAGDFTKAEHHRKMCEILNSIKEREQQVPNKTPEQLSDEDYKVAPTSADKQMSQ